MGLHWLSAEIALGEGDFYTGRALLEGIQTTHSDGSDPFELAIVGLRLAKALLLLADFPALAKLTARTTQLMSPLRRHPFAQATLARF